jgi:hypothetical protein
MPSRNNDRRSRFYVMQIDGVVSLESGVLPKSGEYAPEEAPGALVEALRRFRRSVTSASR